MCDDVKRTMADLRRKGVEFTKPVTDFGYGLVTGFRLPDGSEMGLYEPRHPMAISPGAIGPKSKRASKARRKRPAKRVRARKPARRRGR